MRQVDVGEVHVWRISLKKPPDEERLLSCLSKQEVRRYEEFFNAKSKLHFLVSRYSLRQILARYLKIPINEIVISYSSTGKPQLPAGSQIMFNLSHSSDLGIIAITRNGQIGVDIERVRSIAKLKALCRRFLSRDESKLVLSLQEGLRLRRFFEIWTQKEALLKAKGIGLSTNLNGVCTIKNPAWHIYSLRLSDDYIGALVTSCPVRSVSYFDL